IDIVEALIPLVKRLAINGPNPLKSPVAKLTDEVATDKPPTTCNEHKGIFVEISIKHAKCSRWLPRAGRNLDRRAADGNRFRDQRTLNAIHIDILLCERSRGAVVMRDPS